MSTLPLMFKKEGLVEKHQLEGVDPSDRYFNRTILVNRISSGYSAKIMYEAFVVESRSHSTIAAAVKELVDKLQELRVHSHENAGQFQGDTLSCRKRNVARLPRPVLNRADEFLIHQIMDRRTKFPNRFIPA